MANSRATFSREARLRELVKLFHRYSSGDRISSIVPEQGAVKQYTRTSRPPTDMRIVAKMISGSKAYCSEATPQLRRCSRCNRLSRAQSCQAQNANKVARAVLYGILCMKCVRGIPYNRRVQKFKTSSVGSLQRPPPAGPSRGRRGTPLAQCRNNQVGDHTGDTGHPN